MPPSPVVRHISAFLCVSNLSPVVEILNSFPISTDDCLGVITACLGSIRSAKLPAHGAIGARDLLIELLRARATTLLGVPSLVEVLRDVLECMPIPFSVWQSFGLAWRLVGAGPCLLRDASLQEKQCASARQQLGAATTGCIWKHINALVDGDSSNLYEPSFLLVLLVRHLRAFPEDGAARLLAEKEREKQRADLLFVAEVL